MPRSVGDTIKFCNWNILEITFFTSITCPWLWAYQITCTCFGSFATTTAFTIIPSSVIRLFNRFLAKQTKKRSDVCPCAAAACLSSSLFFAIRFSLPDYGLYFLFMPILRGHERNDNRSRAKQK